MSHSHLVLIRQGKRMPSVDVVGKLASVLGMGEEIVERLVNVASGRAHLAVGP